MTAETIVLNDDPIQYFLNKILSNITYVDSQGTGWSKKYRHNMIRILCFQENKLKLLRINITKENIAFFIVFWRQFFLQ